ncbi:putative lipoyltransferase 2, mitochondrial [Coelomomyces lativittatus]|nr:putative lipoyltransferase 2, mitochondrial [Coelomomyces lativittatus]
MLENTLISVCSQFSIQGETSPHTGVWVQTKKIAAIGLQIQHHVSMHGFALNVSPDLSYFDHIVPCGLPGKKATSILAETGKQVSLQQVITYFVTEFGKQLNVSFGELKTLEPEFYNTHVAPLVSLEQKG